MKLPSELKPELITAIVDTREQLPLDLSPLQTVSGTLDTGDYSVRGLEHVVRVERKSLSDLLGCVGRERSRFDREVTRLLAFPVRVLVVEASWAEIELGLAYYSVDELAFYWSLIEEFDERDTRPIRDVLATEPPERFTELWERAAKPFEAKQVAG